MYAADSAPPYNSTLHNAPLQILSLDPTLCEELLASAVTSRTFPNTTLLVSFRELQSACYFSSYYENPTSLYLALSNAGASAIILIDTFDVPGMLSNLASPRLDHRRAIHHGAPFVAIGASEGSFLIQRLLDDQLNPNAVPLHVIFDFDPNRYQTMYDVWLHWLFKFFVGGFSALALSKANMVGITPLCTTKCLVVLCEVPSILCLLWFTACGPLMFEGPSSTAYLVAGDGLTFVALGSKILVARFWRAYAAHLKRPTEEFVDPVRASPLTSLSIVAIAVLWQCSFAGFRIFYARTNSGDIEAFTTFMAAPFVPAYFAALCYFLHAGTNVLRSLTLDTVSQDKRTYTMTAYLLSSVCFMVVHLIAVAFYAVDVELLSEVHFGLLFFFVYLSRAGTAMCCISMFHAHAGSAFLFMETENMRLAEDVRRLGETADLNSRLSEAEIAKLEEMRRVEAIEIALAHKEEMVQREKNFVAKALHEVGNSIYGISETLKYIFETLKNQLTVDLETELRCIEHCANHVQLFTKNVLSLDKILDGTMALPSVPFSPAKLLEGVRAMTKHSVQPGVTVEAACEGTKLMLQGAPMQVRRHIHHYTHKHLWPRIWRRRC